MKKLLISALCLATMWSCSTDDPATPENQAGDMYMQLSLKMETKSGTTDQGGSDAAPGTEVGLDIENKVSKVDVVLKNGTTVVYAKNVSTISSASKDTYVASFNSLELTGNTTYAVYIYANCSAPDAFDKDAVSTATVADMTAENNFWMTSAYNAEESGNKVTLPQDLSLYTVPQNPYNLGAYNVERSMARFDYMPINENKYNILKDEATNATITLTQAALINQSKEHFMLRRVSADGTNNGAVVGGAENRTNFVVDTDYDEKAGGYVDGLGKNFDYHLTAPNSWDWRSIAVNDLKQKDNWDGEDDGTTDYDGTHDLNEYYVWQYAKENTIPGDKIQDHGISTGVVFKGEITGAAVDAANNGMIYVFENVLYGNWAAVVTASQATNAPATLVAAVNNVKNAFGEATVTDPTDATTAKYFSEAGFTGYNPDSEGKYYAYYYYWNRHNDNGDNTKMGPMEFAVVRNNVYKLCVDKIAKFGHPDPTDPKNPDPDPVDPVDPDEEINYYFTVTVKVLPWVVRVNHIEF